MCAINLNLELSLSNLFQYPFQAVRCKLAEIVPIKDSWSSADQQIMMDVTDGEYFFLDLIQGPGNLATV